MRGGIKQGDVIRVENMKNLVLVVSKDFFNASEMVIGCPVFSKGEEGALHINVHMKEEVFCVYCEQMKLLDLRFRGFSKVGSIKMEDIINITDAIQSIFDYV